MARVVVPAEVRTTYELDLTFGAPTVDGDSVPAGRVYLLVRNLSGVTVTVTVLTTAVASGLNVEDLAVPVEAGDTSLVGPLPASLFAQEADGRAYVNYSAIASVTRAVFTP